MLITIYTYAPKTLLVEWAAILLLGMIVIVIGLYYFLVDIDWHLKKFRDFRDTLYKIIVWPFCLVSFISNYLDIVGIKSLRFGSVLINGIVVGGIFGIYKETIKCTDDNIEQTVKEQLELLGHKSGSESLGCIKCNEYGLYVQRL